MTDDVVYLDNAAATRVLPAVVAQHEALCRAHYANPHASSAAGNRGRIALEGAERRLLALLGIAPGAATTVWTSGGTESLNLAVQGWVGSQSGGCRIDVDPLSHAALLEPCRACAARGARLGELPLSLLRAASAPGLDVLKSESESAPRLVAVTQVNNETGAIADLSAVRRWAAAGAPAAVLLVDAAQAFTKFQVAWDEAGIDLLAVSGRKIGGPAAVGALVIRRGVTLAPMLFGGGQQGGLRPGTVDVVGVLEFVSAAEIAADLQKTGLEHITALNRELRHRLLLLPRVQPVFVAESTASPYILSVALPGYEGAVLMRALGERGIIVGTGSACSSSSSRPSRVLTRLGIPDRVARGVLRISFAPDNSVDDVVLLVRTLAEILECY